MTRQHVSKAPDALRTIGEVAVETGIAPHILRYWERNVAELQPLRRAGGRRYFRAEDIALVRRLHQLVAADGYTLEGAARAVRSRPSKADVPANALAEPQPQAALGNHALLPLHWQRLRARLQAALEQDLC